MKTHSEIAKEVGVTRQAVQAWFSGVSRPSLDNAVKLANSLGMTLDQAVILVQEEVTHREKLRRKKETG